MHSKAIPAHVLGFFEPQREPRPVINGYRIKIDEQDSEK